MKKTILTFGLISGAVSAVMMTISAIMGDNMNFDTAEVIGYTSIVLSFILVFFGIRSFRENSGGGTITFGKAFKVGILITLISCLCYVVAWLIVYYNFMPDFMDKYAAHTIDKMKAKGESAEAIQKATDQMLTYKELYKNPLMVAGLTFLEPFPIGLVITLVSSFILKRKKPTPEA